MSTYAFYQPAAAADSDLPALALDKKYISYQ
jgi:hypothetical protein